MTGPVDWDSIPVTMVPVARFVIPLHDLDLAILRLDPDPERVVRAFSRWLDQGPVEVTDGRHAVLRAVLAGWETVPCRLLVIP